MKKRAAYKNKKRVRMHDSLLNPHAKQVEIIIDHSVAAFDRKSREMDEYWGIDRLIELVDPQVAATFGKAIGRLNEAIEKKDADLVRLKVADCIRGMDYMHNLAIEAKCKPADASYWEVEIDGNRFGLVADHDAWPRVRKERPDLEIVSLREFAVVWHWFNHKMGGRFTDEVRDILPAAEVVKIEEFNDPIPF